MNILQTPAVTDRTLTLIIILQTAQKNRETNFLTMYWHICLN